MNHIPIYLAQVTLAIVKKNAATEKVTALIELGSVVVKGFYAEDIFNRCQKRLISKIKSIPEGSYVKLHSMDLISQHGYGVR